MTTAYWLPSIRIVCLAVVTLPAWLGASGQALADKPKASGVIQFAAANSGEAMFSFGGTEKHIGRYTSSGELDFVPIADGTMDGTGVVVLMAANGDLLVGEVTCHLDLDGEIGDLHFSWRDSITLRNGMVVSNTGRFLKHRPPGLVVILSTQEQTIINILIIILRGVR